MKIGPVWISVATIAIGCSGPPRNESQQVSVNPGAIGQEAPSGVKTADAERALYENMRAGAVGLAGCIESLGEALQECDRIRNAAGGNWKRALTEAYDLIDSAGAGISNFSEEPPPLEAFRKQFATQHEKRLKAVRAANDALHDLDQAIGIVKSLNQEPTPPPEGTKRLQALLEVIAADLVESIGSFGGTVEPRGD